MLYTELEGIKKSTNVIPGYATCDEAAFFVIEAAEAAFKDLMMDIGINELAVLEATGEEIVYEAEGIKKIVDNVIKWLKDRWADIKALFDKVMKAIQSKVNEFRKFANTAGGAKLADLKEKIQFMAADKPLGETFRFDNWTYADMVYTKLRGLEDFANKDGITIEILETNIKNTIKLLSGKETAKDSEIREYVMKQIQGDKVEMNKAWLNSNIDRCYKLCSDYGFALGNIKKAYADNRKGFDKSIKDVRASEKKFKDKLFNPRIKVIKTAKRLSIVAAGAVISCRRKEISAARLAIYKLAFGKKKADEKAAVKESATPDGNNASLFDFKW